MRQLLRRDTAILGETRSQLRAEALAFFRDWLERVWNSFSFFCPDMAAFGGGGSYGSSSPFGAVPGMSHGPAGVALSSASSQQAHSPYAPQAPQDSPSPSSASPSFPSPQGQQQRAAFVGLVASGRPVMTTFNPVGDGKRFFTTITSPASVPEISVFLLPAFQSAMSQGMGLTVYWCKDGSNWQIIGSLSAHKPSDIFRTGWPSDPELAHCAALRVGVSVESLAQIKSSQDHGSREVGARLGIAKSIAHNLFSFMESFTQRHQQNGKEWLILPTDCLTRWIERFNRRIKLDPQFFMKK